VKAVTRAADEPKPVLWASGRVVWKSMKREEGESEMGMEEDWE
jgi:hypothetical protein